jgi:site-specific DNA-cytosine methylase
MIPALGAHIYAGGFTLGVGRHFKVLAHLEHEGYGSNVVRLNFPDLPIYTGGPAKWPAFWHEAPRFIFANPPCAIWSGASKTSKADRWHLDPRLDQHDDIFNYAMDVVAPDVLAIESVPLSFTKGRRYIISQIIRAETYGYAMTAVRHNAMWFGVPQNRPRIFYIFHKVVIPWSMPDFTAPTTVRQAFSKLNGASNGYKLPVLMPRIMRSLKLTPPGGKLRQTYYKITPVAVRNPNGTHIGAPSFLHQRLSWDKPAPVPLEVYHPTEHRRLTQDELATICSYPTDYHWPVRSSQANVTHYMNRGIMPKTAEWLALQISQSLQTNNRINDLSPMIFNAAEPPGGHHAFTD